MLIPLSLAYGVLPSKLKLKKNKKNVLEVFRNLEFLIKVSGNKWMLRKKIRRILWRMWLRYLYHGFKKNQNKVLIVIKGFV